MVKTNQKDINKGTENKATHPCFRNIEHGYQYSPDTPPHTKKGQRRILLLIVDKFTGFTWSFFLVHKVHKQHTGEVMSASVHEGETERGHKVKFIRCDTGWLLVK